MQTVAGSMAIMPLGCGFVGVVSLISLWTLQGLAWLDLYFQLPAMNYLLAPEENAALSR